MSQWRPRMTFFSRKTKDPFFSESRITQSERESIPHLIGATRVEGFGVNGIKFV